MEINRELDNFKQLLETRNQILQDKIHLLEKERLFLQAAKESVLNFGLVDLLDINWSKMRYFVRRGG
jgi:predicted component of type VI protein secretion system